MIMNKIIIWGHPLYSHSHSFIQDGFYRAFGAMGFETHWFDSSSDVSNFDFSNCIFLSEGQVIDKMPLRSDCSYILHNAPYLDGIGKRVNIQYLTKDSYNYEKIAHGITALDNCVFAPWGSPFLPHEFNVGDVDNIRNNTVVHIGTLNGPSDGGNFEAVSGFMEEAFKDGKVCIAGGGFTAKVKNNINYISGWVSKEVELQYLRSCFMAPALQGENQLVNGMLSCRLFKSISTGNDIITNNPLALEFFDGNIVYHDNPTELYHCAKSRYDKTRIRQLMLFVRENHTYINNIQAILKLL